MQHIQPRILFLRRCSLLNKRNYTQLYVQRETIPKWVLENELYQATAYLFL
jgi:hypothetical protein